MRERALLSMFVTMKRKTLYFIIRNFLIIFVMLAIYFAYDKQTGTSYKRFMPYYIITLWFFWILIHNTLLLEKLLFKRNYILYAILTAAGIVLMGYVELQLVIAAGVKTDSLKGAILTTLFYTFVGTCLYLAYRYVMEKKTFYQLASIKREIELQQLKSQLNPHFLFNALNNIYSYTLHSNKFGNELILKLSELMRFIIDSSKKDTVTLAEEIKFIENYIAFEKERLGERCYIDYRKNVNSADCDIPALILFPFIENAFKYGTNTIQKTTVEIVLNDSHDQFNMIVKNNIINNNTTSTKIGLPNVKRRLELLYPGKHELNIAATDDVFIVDLTLKK